MLNKGFVNLLINPTHFDFEASPFLKPFVTKDDLMTIVFIKYNEQDGQVEVVKKLGFDKLVIS